MMKTKYLVKKAFAFVLCVSMVLWLIPSGVNAAVNVTEQATEVVSLREENVKHFDMGNGIYQAIAYSHPVHELDNEGNWQDIDFGMNLTQTKGIRAYTNSAGTALAANYTANQPLVTLSGEGTAIAMTLVPDTSTATMSTRAMASTATVAAELTATQTQIQTFEDAQAASFSNTLLYENVMPGVDLEYIVDPWTVKENIIVNQPASKYEYRFKLDLTGLYPILQDDGSIYIYGNETDQKKYLIPAPYMYDATGEMSFDVNFTLAGSNGIYYLTVTTDDSWVNAEDRVFPVVIDPTVNTVTRTVNMDTYINEDTPNEARGLYKFFFVGENEVAYIYMPTPTDIPSGMVLYKADLLLYYFYKDTYKNGYVDITAHQVDDFYWAQESLTWNSVVSNDAYDNFGLADEALGSSVRTFSDIGATSTTPKPVNVDITSAVWSWMDETSENLGIGLKFVFGSPNRSVLFRSTEGPATYRPTLVYHYGAPTYSYIINNYYDKSLSSTCVGMINKAVADASTVYNNQFSITFSSAGISHKSTLTDQCPLDINVSCSNSCTDPHHKDILYISDELYDESRDLNEITAFWTNRDPLVYCSHLSGSCLLRTDLAVVYKFRPVIHFMSLTTQQETSSEYQACMSLLLMHETAHTFGLPDVYTNENHNQAGWGCVMETYDYTKTPLINFYNSITLHGADAFCDSCAQKLKDATKRGLYDRFYDCN